MTDELPLLNVPTIPKMAAKATATVASARGPPTSMQVWEHDFSDIISITPQNLGLGLTKLVL